MRGGRDSRLPGACSNCGREAAPAYSPDDWAMRIDPAAPGGVVAICPECVNAEDTESPRPDAQRRPE